MRAHHEKEVNLFLLIGIALTVLQAVFSFFPCYREVAYSSVADDFFLESWSDTDTFYANAKWLIFSLSVIEVGLLLFNKKWTVKLGACLSGVLALITLCYPFYLSLKCSLFGSTYEYRHTVYGYMVLAIDVAAFVAWLIYNRQVKKEQNRC